MEHDGERWDTRYRDTSTGPPRPPDGLTGIELPSSGLCLDVACGRGEQSLWAAGRGFDVIALDVSPVAIELVREAAVAHGVADRIDARVVDLDAGLPDDVSGRCTLVICQRFRDVRLYSRLVDAARPGGLIVVTVLSSVGLDGDAGEFHAPPGELLEHFGALDVEILTCIEGSGGATLVARR